MSRSKSDKKPEENYPDTEDNSRVVKDHIALRHQSSVKATQYPASQRAAQSLVRPNANVKDKKNKKED